MGHVAVVTRPGRVALGTRPKHVVLAALPGTIALRAIVPEARRPVVETCAPQVGATASTSVVDVPLVKPGTVVKSRGASDLQTVCPTSRQQAPVVSVKARCPNNNTLVKRGADVPKTRTKVPSLPVKTPVRWRKPREEFVPRELLDDRNRATLQQPP